MQFSSHSGHTRQIGGGGGIVMPLTSGMSTSSTEGSSGIGEAAVGC